jgi:hypothetical protein
MTRQEYARIFLLGDEFRGRRVRTVLPPSKAVHRNMNGQIIVSSACATVSNSVPETVFLLQCCLHYIAAVFSFVFLRRLRGNLLKASHRIPVLTPPLAPPAAASQTEANQEAWQSGGHQSCRGITVFKKSRSIYLSCVCSHEKPDPSLLARIDDVSTTLSWTN